MKLFVSISIWILLYFILPSFYIYLSSSSNFILGFSMIQSWFFLIQLFVFSFSKKQLKVSQSLVFLINSLILYFLATVYVNWNILLNGEILLYCVQNFTYLLAEAIPFCQRLGYLWIIFYILGIVLWKLFYTRSSLFIPKKFLLAMVFVLAVYTFYPSKSFDLKESTQETITMETNVRIQKPNFVFFLLEGVRQKSFPKNISKYFQKNNLYSTEIEYFFIPTPHSNHSIFSFLTGKYFTDKNIKEYKNFNINPFLEIKNHDYELNFYSTQPTEVEDVDEILKTSGFNVFSRVDYKKEKKYEEFIWGVDDHALLDSAKIETKKSKRPFFTIYQFSNTHSPYFCKKNPSLEQKIEGYHCAIVSNLEIIDQILDIYSSSRDFGSTYFILVSDHGESFGEHGFWKHNFSLYNEEIRVPFWIFHPKKKILMRNYGSILELIPTIQEIIYEGKVSNSLLRENKHFELKLKSWKSNDFMGMIQAQKKWITETKSNRTVEMNWDDENIKEVKVNSLNLEN
ncbi:MAG: sulfatase-like hydrolase/transferase [Leptospiraceae bacterium]|nr:sulfatase-like hydrolase/transferase [Leptospiraceae bacterium]